MALSVHRSLWDDVVELTKTAQDKVSDPLFWAVQISAALNSAGVAVPSPELAEVLVSYICWDNNVPVLWKFLEKALTLKIVPPLLVLALLSDRVITCRRVRPGAYRLYMELLKRHVFTFKCHINGPNYQKIMISIDAALRLSETFGLQASEPGILVVEFIFSIVWQLLEASLDDEGLLELTPERKPRWGTKCQEMEIDGHEIYDDKRIEHHEKLQKMNSVMAIEIIGQLLENKVTSRILYLAHQNLPTHWAGFIQRIEILAANSTLLKNTKVLTPEVLLQLTSDPCILLSRERKTTVPKKCHVVMGLGHGASRSAPWLPLDLVLEDVMDGYQVNATSAIEILTGLTKTLQAVNGTTWHDTFLGLWFAALRFVQRERDPIDGPMPGLDTRLCLLLSIIPLVIANLIEEEENASIDEACCGSTNHWKEKRILGKRRNDLISSLQELGDYQGLLTPPQSAVTAANQAAARAMLFVSGISVGSAYFDCINMKDMPINCSGNMRHLIVEACVARNLLDTSAYFWPGYVNGRINQMPHGLPTQVPGWSSFMKGALLTPVMVNALVSSPASSQGYQMLFFVNLPRVKQLKLSSWI